MDTQPESYGFKAEIQQLLHILAHSLYKDRDIFLRELISNASDALTRLQFEALTNSDILDPAAEPAIHIEVIGQFGVGFYSVFMVAARVRVVSRSFRPEAAAVAWESDGGDLFLSLIHI